MSDLVHLHLLIEVTILFGNPGNHMQTLDSKVIENFSINLHYKIIEIHYAGL